MKAVKKKVVKVKKRPEHLPAGWQKQVVKFREQKGLSQRALGELMGISWLTILRWEQSPPRFFPSRFVWARFQEVKAESNGK